eukprot:3458685-Prymnesium_polylepis.1
MRAQSPGRPRPGVPNSERVANARRKARRRMTTPSYLLLSTCTAVLSEQKEGTRVYCMNARKGAACATCTPFEGTNLSW